MKSEPLLLRLYISGKAPNSLMAVKNLKVICEAQFPDNYSIEVIDLFEQPYRAIEDGVMITPMLMSSSSPPVSIIGDLSDTEGVINALMTTQQ